MHREATWACRGRRVLFCALALLLLWPPCPGARAERDFVTTPRTNGGEPWRIGYYQGGPYFNYERNLRGFLQGLMTLGWVDVVELPELDDPEDTRTLWRFACERLSGTYLRFVPEAFWSVDWDAARRPEVRADAVARLARGEVDFMLAAGTWAGQDLATDAHHVPLTVCAVSDPVQSGIVLSAQESGLPHVHAKCDPERYVRMTRLFYNLFHFKRLGITYENTPLGRVHAAVREIEQVSQEFGFEVVHCEAPFTGVPRALSEQAVIDCQRTLAQTVDAAIIPVHRGVTTRGMSRILAPYFERRVPTFSQQGSLEVRHGVLMGMTLGNEAFRRIGLFHAKVAVSALNGVPPGELPLVFEDPRALALNRETARRIGYVIPPGLKLVAEEIFDTISPDTDQ